MATVAFTTRANLVGGQPENIADVTSCLDGLLAGVNGIDKEQLTTAHAQLLGMNNGTNVGRGKCIIATSESRTNTAYGLMPTPDRVSSIVLPTDGLIFVAYQALWAASAGGFAGRAAIFLNSTQLKITDAGSTAPFVSEQSATSAAGFSAPLCTTATGLSTASSTSNTNADATTGQLVAVTAGSALGGPCTIFAAAGTYDISVQFKATSGNVAVSGRKLWVWTIAF